MEKQEMLKELYMRLTVAISTNRDFAIAIKSQADKDNCTIAEAIYNMANGAVNFFFESNQQ